MENAVEDCCYVCLSSGLDDETGEGALILGCGHRVHFECIANSITDVINRRGCKINTNVAMCGICRQWLSHPLLVRRVSAIKQLKNELTTLLKNESRHMLGTNDAVSVFFRCYTCGNPFLGGSQACLGNPVNDDSKDVVCSSCRRRSEFWFCCNQARYFCWGTTHLCESCHHPPVTRKPKPCRGCHNAGTHPPNDGREHALGCSLCWVSEYSPASLGF
eukprot:CFRG5295T1